MSGLSQSTSDNSLSTRKGKQESDNSEAEEGSEPAEDTDDSLSARLENEKEEVEDGLPPPPEGQGRQNAANAIPPGPPALVRENEGVEARVVFSQASAVETLDGG